MDLRKLTIERLGTLIAINCQKQEMAKKMNNTDYLAKLEEVRATLLKALDWKVANA
jgi:hypothetical protein